MYTFYRFKYIIEREGALYVIVLSMEFMLVGFFLGFHHVSAQSPSTSLNIALGHPKTLRHGVGVEFMDKDINGHWLRPLHQ